MMNNEIIIRKPNLHEGQLYIKKNKKRFNVCANGRRWGKSILAIELLMHEMLNGYPVAYFVPSFTFADDVWNEIKDRFEDIIDYKSESKHFFKIKTGGSFKVWSLENKIAGRSRKYKRVIVDEAAFVPHLKESWERAIRPTLTDMKGDAFFMSSPVYGTPFHELFENENKPNFENWVSFQMPTSTNPYISKDELEEIKLQLDPYTYAQEYEGKFVNLRGNAFAHCFKRDIHVKDFGELKKNMPVYLSFDFNASPMTCIASQHSEDHSYIYTRLEFRLPNSDIYDMCDMIKTKLQGYYFIVTGDASGSNATGLGKNLNYYVVIKAQLKLTDLQIILPKKNPLIKNSRILCNAILYRHPQVFIHPDCEHLIKDLELVQIKDNGDIDKESNPSLTHLLDCWRYYINTFFKTFVTLR